LISKRRYLSVAAPELVTQESRAANGKRIKQDPATILVNHLDYFPFQSEGNRELLLSHQIICK
jgi:hypothetical protein